MAKTSMNYRIPSMLSLLSAAALAAMPADAMAMATLAPPAKAAAVARLWIAQRQQPRRHALVIGNGAYGNGDALTNPVHDAEDLAQGLREIGFAVQLLRNADKRTIDEAVNAFSRKLQQGDTGLFFYAGHGIQVNGENYLIPIGAQLNREQDVDYDAYPLGKVINALEDSSAAAKLIILDACRDTPMFTRQWRSSSRGAGSRGLAIPTNTGRGTLIAFSTAPGKPAADQGSGRNSPFTQHLLRHLKTPNLDVRIMLGKVRSDVAKDTRNAQIPWTNEALEGELYLNPQAISARMAGAANMTTETIPKFEGEIGFGEKSSSFSQFVFSHIKQIVFIKAEMLAGRDELKVTTNNFGVDYFTLWEKCDTSGRLSTLPPWSCTGLSITIDRSRGQKDADATLVRGTLSVEGYFVIAGCGGPHQGLMGCTFRPLDSNEALR